MTDPSAAKSSSCCGRVSTLVPRSMITVFGAYPTIGPPRAPRSTPSMVPNTTVAAAIDAPVEPILTNAAALPALTAPAATKTDALGFDRNAVTGDSSSATTPLERTTCSGRFDAPSRSISGWIKSGSPTSAMATGLCLTASTAPATVSRGPWSPPMASSAMGINPPGPLILVVGSKGPPYVSVSGFVR